MTIESFDEIQQINDREMREVEVPEWNDSVYIRQLSAGDFAEMIDSAKKDDAERVMFLLVAYCLVDSNGERIIDADQVGELASKSKEAITRIYDEANKLTGLFQVDEEKKG